MVIVILYVLLRGGSPATHSHFIETAIEGHLIANANNQISND